MMLSRETLACKGCTKEGKVEEGASLVSGGRGHTSGSAVLYSNNPIRTVLGDVWLVTPVHLFDQLISQSHYWNAFSYR